MIKPTLFGFREHLQSQPKLSDALRETLVKFCKKYETVDNNSVYDLESHSIFRPFDVPGVNGCKTRLDIQLFLPEGFDHANQEATLRFDSQFVSAEDRSMSLVNHPLVTLINTPSAVAMMIKNLEKVEEEWKKLSLPINESMFRKIILDITYVRDDAYLALLNTVTQQIWETEFEKIKGSLLRFQGASLILGSITTKVLKFESTASNLLDYCYELLDEKLESSNSEKQIDKQLMEKVAILYHKHTYGKNQAKVKKILDLLIKNINDPQVKARVIMAIAGDTPDATDLPEDD